MDKEVKIFFIIIFICMIVISIISVGLILKRRKVLVIVGLVILTVELIVAIIPCVLDYGNALNNRYEVTSGIALNNSKSSKVPWRTAEILEDTSGRKITLMFFSEKINKGDYLVVKYLKHLKFGILMEKTDGKNDCKRKILLRCP